MTRATTFITILVGASALSACTVGETAEPAPLELDEFVEKYIGVHETADGSTMFTYDDDMLIESQEEIDALYAAYRTATTTGEQVSYSLVSQTNGKDNIWPAAVRRDLTFCVSNAFGAYKPQIVSAMTGAAADWVTASAGKVRHVYVPAQDAACTNTNTAVVFNVVPMNPPLARVNAIAFFPSYPRERRQLRINLGQFFGPTPTRSPLVGVMRHELGHTLGLRHETLHRDIVKQYGPRCLEDLFYREVLGPIEDIESVMTTAVCLGADLQNTNPNRTISFKDRIGIQLIYK